MSKIQPSPKKVEEVEVAHAYVEPEPELVDGTPFFQKPCCCHDFFFILLFVLYLVGLIVIWSIGAERGDIRRLVYPMDKFGNLCGIDNGGETTNFENKPYLAWYDPQDWESQICVAACKSNAVELHANISMTRFTRSEIYDTTADLSKNYPRYDDIEILRRCQPKDLSNLPPQVRDSIESSSPSTFYADMSQSMWIIVLMALTSAGLCLFFVFFLRYFACEMMYLAAVCAIILLTSASVFLILKGSGELPDDYNVTGENTFLANKFGDEEAKVSLAIGIVLLLVDVVVIGLVCWFNSKIKLVGNIIEEAGLVLMDVKSLFFVPILTLVLSVAWFFLWLYFTMMVVSSGSIDVSDSVEFSLRKCACTCEQPGVRIGEFDSVTKFALVYDVAALLWVWSFIFAVTRTTIAGVAGTWYFTRDKDDIAGKSDQLTGFIVGSTILRTLRYNLGSLAFGSLTLTVVTMIKWFINACLFTAKRTKNVQCMAWFVACVNCCIKVIATIIEYITKYAYIEIALYGIGFCKAAHRSFDLISENITKVAVVDTVGDFVLFLCQFAISSLVAFVFYGIVVSDHYTSTYGALTHPKAIAIVTGGIAYVVTMSFFGVMESVIDTILVCFCEDVKSNDPEHGRPYFMRDSLRKCLEEHENLMDTSKSSSS